MVVWFIYLLHLLGAVALGYYLLMPFTIAKLSEHHKEHAFLRSVLSFNRIAQWLLVVQILTGGYLLSKSEYSVAWWVISIIIAVAIGAISGMMGVPMKRIVKGDESRRASDISRVRLFSGLVSVLFLVIIILMYDPTII